MSNTAQPEDAVVRDTRVAGLGLQGIERVRGLVAGMPRSHLYPLLGVGIGLAITVGFITVHSMELGRSFTLGTAVDDIARLPLTYGYVLLSFLMATIAGGYVLGRSLDSAHLLSITDPLTGLFNRRHFGERMMDEMSRARRKGTRTTILCLDLDHLKTINDDFGHEAGDCALVSVARTLSKSTRPTDVVARFGGDEFVVLLPETTSAEAKAVSARILAEVARQGSPSIGGSAVSIGIAELSPTADAVDVLTLADMALYRAKAQGGGQVVIAQPGVEWCSQQVTMMGVAPRMRMHDALPLVVHA